MSEGIIAHLRALGNSEITPIDLDHGVCAEIYNMYGVTVPAKIYEKWTECSNSSSNPVRCAPSLFNKGKYNGGINHWDNDEYGDNRRRLCLWLADYFECNGIMSSWIDGGKCVATNSSPVKEGPARDFEGELKHSEERFQDVQHRLDKAEILLKTVRERNVYVETMLAKLIN